MIATLLVIAFLAGAVSSFFVGYRIGLAIGMDKEWLRNYFNRVEADRARRNRLGQFRGKGAQS